MTRTTTMLAAMTYLRCRCRWARAARPVSLDDPASACAAGTGGGKSAARLSNGEPAGGADVAGTFVAGPATRPVPDQSNGCGRAGTGAEAKIDNGAPFPSRPSLGEVATGGKGWRGGGVFSPWSKSSAIAGWCGDVGGAMSGGCVPGSVAPRTPDERFSGLVIGALSNSFSNAGVGEGSPARRGVKPGKAGPFFGDGTTDNLGAARGPGAPGPKSGRGVSQTESGTTGLDDLAPDPELGGGNFGLDPGASGTGTDPDTRSRAPSGTEPPTGADLGPDPGMGGGALCPEPGTGGGADLGPDPGMGGGPTLGPEPGTLGDGLRPEPGCGSFALETKPPAGGGFGLAPGARTPGARSAGEGAEPGADEVPVRAGAGGGVLAAPSSSAAISWATIATSSGRFQPSMPSFQTWTDCSGLRETMNFAASVQLSGPCSAPSTEMNHSCGPEGGRKGFEEGTETDAELARALASGRREASWGPGITSPACTVMTLLQVLQRMRRIRCLTLSSAME